ncbi:hypothetical protein [Cycloclasticus zancles]|uniref:Uncharacterized protein n=1 Tax=Cycloclasticus zancles 78-ME TaxID=1198232 RepID=S5TJ40_9GAMM|nr:hypothetical protein [Cycloclasticus zancles]AGS40902.1 hypothetical protein CYCME_3026 [Cycloclasticus zancles 78-ME]
MASFLLVNLGWLKNTSQIELLIVYIGLSVYNSQIEYTQIDYIGSKRKMERTELEAMAKEVCPASLWYELMDCLDETPDQDLVNLIAENQE